MKAIKKEGNKIKVPIVRFNNTKTDKDVVFVGTVHIGLKSYFDKLQKIIDDFENFYGAKVLYEGIGELSKVDKSELSDDELDIYNQISRLDELRTFVCNTLELSNQKDCIFYPEDAVNSDIDINKLIKDLANKNVKLISENDFRDLNTNDPRKLRIIKKTFKFLFKNMNKLEFILRFGCSKRIKAINKIILDERNKVAVDYINKYLKEHDDVVTIWGVGHLRGIAKELKKMGFKEKERKWFTFYEI